MVKDWRLAMKSLGKLSMAFYMLLLCLVLTSCSQLGKSFGPTDKGGTYLIIEVKGDPAQMDQNIARTMAVMQKRCDDLQVYCKLERLGGDKPRQIKLRISAEQDPERIKEILLSEGMELRAVVSPPYPSPPQSYSTKTEAEAVGKDKDVLPYNEEHYKSFVVLESGAIITGSDVKSAEAVPSPSDPKNFQINFTLNSEGAKRFGDWTATHVDNYLAVIMNKEVRSLPAIKSQITDAGQITGHYSKREAEDVALILMSGNLPAPIEALEEGIYKP